MKAKLLGVDEVNASFQLENGRVIDYPLKHLSEESRDCASSQSNDY